MKKIITRLFITILMASASAIAAAAAAAAADNRGYGFLMLEEPSNPKNVAMGSVGTAMGGAGFRYYNPVLPFFAEAPYVAAEFGQMPGGVNRGGFESALVFSEWFSAVSFHTSSVGFETRDERGFGADAASATTVGALGTGYIRDNLSAGVSVNMVEERIWVEAHYAAFALSGGLGYKLLDKKLNVGAAGFYGIGWSRGYGEGASAAVWQEGRVPRFARAGAAWTDTLKSFPYTIAADAVYRDEDKTFTVPVGISVGVLPVVDLRVGKRIGWESEIVSLGIGLNIDKMAFDAAFVPSVLVSDYEIKWSMALTYNLGAGGWKKGKKPLLMPPAEVKAPVEEKDEEAEGAGGEAETLQEDGSGDVNANPDNIDMNELDDVNTNSDNVDMNKLDDVNTNSDNVDMNRLDDVNTNSDNVDMNRLDDVNTNSDNVDMNKSGDVNTNPDNVDMNE